MDFLEENTVLIIGVTFIVTLILVVVSTLYTIRNASKAKLRNATRRNADENVKTEESRADTEESPSEGLESGGDPTDVQNNTGLVEKQPARKVIDPVQYCEHIQSEVKKARQRVATREIEQSLTEEDVVAEREAQRKQLEDIFKLMEQQNDKFGVNEMDEVYQQMKLYA